MCEQVMFWATIASPIIGTIAIIVALCVSHRSSRDAQKQIDVFMAAQAPNMLEALDAYKQQLAELEEKIQRAQQEYDVVDPFLYLGGPLIDKIDRANEKRAQKQQLDQLKQQRQKVLTQIQLIESFLSTMK